jgi:hypothetical protein
MRASKNLVKLVAALMVVCIISLFGSRTLTTSSLKSSTVPERSPSFFEETDTDDVLIVHHGGAWKSNAIKTYNTANRQLQLSDYYREDADFPLCNDPGYSVPLRIFVMMAAWNDVNLLKKAIYSVANQKLKAFPFQLRVTLLIYEDESEDMLAEQEKAMLSSMMDVQFFKAECEDDTVCPQLGSAGSKWALLSHLKAVANPSDYVFVLDGDDTLADSSVMQDLSEVLTKKPWFIWGKHNGKYSEQCLDLPRERDLSNFNFRTELWSYCHPRIFQAHLLGTIEAADFKREDGTWLQKATDRPFIFKMLESSGADRIHFWNERPPTVNYTFTANNGLVRFEKSVIAGDKAYINSLAPVDLLPVTIDVITAIYDRNNTEVFIRRLMKSNALYNWEFNFHICLNDKSRLGEMLELAEAFSRPGKQVIIHLLADNYGGFSRFLVAKKLRLKTKLQYIIMLDDDMLVYPTTLMQLWEYRAPLTFACWYGKVWAEDKAEEPDYWKPLSPGGVSALLKNSIQLKKFTEYQYGGTGCSIVDASIFDAPRLFEIPSRFLFVEDLWLSYIVLLSGWRIPRVVLQFEMDYELNKGGQWANLKTTKSNMFYELMRCSTSLFKAFHNNWNAAPQITLSPHIAEDLE